MKYRVSLFFFLFALSSHYVDLHAEVFSWHHKNLSSLKLISTIGVIYSNCSLMAVESNATFITEDIEIQQFQHFSKVFSRFTKKLMSSYIVVTLIDAYTDQKIQSWTFYENEAISITDLPVLSDRVHFKIAIFGKDIELRTVGLVSEDVAIITDQDFKFSSTVLYAETDLLDMSLSLRQEAKLYLYIYDYLGKIVKKISDGQVLAKGDYHYQWDPESSKNIQSGNYYYVWAKFENLRSKPVEFTQNIYVIPKHNE
ncbi:MAG: hypothetical protein ACRCTJ_04295 [Brevinema sp.]